MGSEFKKEFPGLCNILPIRDSKWKTNIEVNMSKKHHHHKKQRTRKSLSIWLIIGAILVLALIVILIVKYTPGVKQAAQPEAQPTAQAAAPTTLLLEISVQEAYAQYQQGVFVLDVREQSEWDAFHIPNTTLIPLGELPNRLEELPRDQPIIVVCRSGNRSQQGRDLLLQAGFTHVTSMTGGVTQWSNQGYPIDGTRP
jgi:rhodanese-related sulfurtransferase